MNEFITLLNDKYFIIIKQFCTSPGAIVTATWRRVVGVELNNKAACFRVLQYYLPNCQINANSSKLTILCVLYILFIFVYFITFIS